jgi:hypothetical protein
MGLAAIEFPDVLVRLLFAVWFTSIYFTFPFAHTHHFLQTAQI